MKAEIRDYETKDLTKYKIKNKETLNEAITQIRAQINKWIEKNENKKYIYGMNSILSNKLVYYISKEVGKVNDEFVIDRGWYIYGPCFEEGRWLEVNNTPITFALIAKEYTPEIDKVCSDLFPKFRECEIKQKVLDDFLRYIYTKRCDKKDFKDFYSTKHEMWCLTHNIQASNLDFSETDPMMVRQIARNFEKIFYDRKYERLVSLSSDEIKDIHEFLDYKIEYLNFMVEEQRRLPIITDVYNVYVDTVMTGLSHLNYAETFESCVNKIKKNKNEWHTLKGHEYLRRLKDENRRLSRDLFNLMYRAGT